MEKITLILLISFASLCNAGLTQYSNNGFLTLASEESEDSNEEPETQCGMIISSDSPQFKIQKRITIGGTDTKYMEYPWMVALFAPRPTRSNCALTDSDCWFFRCGGSLINLKVILTTGLCVHPYIRDKVKARAGDWNLDTLEEPLPYQERYVEKHIIHERFVPSNSGYDLRYDAALLIVDLPYTSADNIGFICLPPPDLDVATASCKTAGWGVMNLGEYGYRKLLQVVDVDYVDHSQCERSLRQLWWSSAVLHDSFICAGGVPKKGICQGDGGSPLMCRAEDHYYARGLTSWLIGCGTSNIPGVYTDVVQMRDWIDRKMRANGFGTNTYTHVAYRK